MEQVLGFLLLEHYLYSAMAVVNRVYMIETRQIIWEALPDDLLSNQDIIQRYLGIH